MKEELYQRYLQRHMRFDAWIEPDPHRNLDTVVVIPVYAEEDIFPALFSLYETDRSGHFMEVLVVINEKAAEIPEVTLLNDRTEDELRHFSTKYNAKDFTVFYIRARNLPPRKAGVGLARKIGMDEAVRRLHHNRRNGVIINYDADCTCDRRLIHEVHRYLHQHPSHWAAGIYFEHPLDVFDEDLTAAIVQYEMHLRYFIFMQRALGLPYAYHTVGSSMAVNAEGYMKMGGMNTRQAGEDFHFLQKFISAGHFGEVANTTVFPSARPSFRVPFGTGKAVSSILDGQIQTTHAGESFRDLGILLQHLPICFEGRADEIALPEPVSSYLQDLSWLAKIRQIRNETNSFASFQKRFYQWFNALQLIKYVHHCRQWYPDQPVQLEARKVYRKYTGAEPGSDMVVLEWFRANDRKSMAE